jgi:thymidylate kinase
VVLADRYLLSTLVYWSTAVHAVVLKRLIAPDLGIWLDAAPDTAAQRIRTSRNEPEELRDPRRLARHRHRYRRLVDHYGYVTISTDGGPAAVWTQTLRRLTPELHAAPSAQGGGSDG